MFFSAVHFILKSDLLSIDSEVHIHLVWVRKVVWSASLAVPGTVPPVGIYSSCQGTLQDALGIINLVLQIMAKGCSELEPSTPEPPASVSFT